MHTEYQLTLFAEDFHVRTCPLQEKEPDLKDQEAASGLSSTGSLKKSGRRGSSSKTYQSFALEDWTEFSGHSLRSGMMRNGTVYPLQPLALATEGTASGSWPTPATKGYGHAAEGMVLNLINKIKDGTISKEEAEQMLGLPALENHRTWKKMWLTPQAGDAKACLTGTQSQTMLSHQVQWPTPAARDYKGMSGAGRQERKGFPKDTLPNAVGGKLNPMWVEWLMGFPAEWTDLSN
jgi:hypothetical protein